MKARRRQRRGALLLVCLVLLILFLLLGITFVLIAGSFSQSAEAYHKAQELRDVSP